MPSHLSPSSHALIALAEAEPFAKGGRRACYVHPEDPDKCIKVALPGRRPSDLRKKDPWWKQLRSDDYYDENIKDYQLLHGLFHRLGPRAEAHLPRPYAMVETDLGPGLETELIRDHDGAISLSCKEYVYTHGADSACRRALLELRSFLFEGLVPLRDAFPHNIALRRNADGSLTAKIIDGLGNTGVFQHWQRIPKVARKRLERKYARLLIGVERTAAVRASGVRLNYNGFQQKTNAKLGQ